MLKWKSNVYNKIKLNKYKLEIESNYEKRCEKEFNAKESSLKEKSEKNVELKKSIQKNNDLLVDYNRKVKEFDEKVAKMQISTKKLEVEFNNLGRKKQNAQ